MANYFADKLRKKAFDTTKYKDLYPYMEAYREYRFNLGYVPLHKHLYSYRSLSDKQKVAWEKRYIHPDMLFAEETAEWNWVIEEPIPDVLHFPFLTQELCAQLIEEAEHFNGWLGEDAGPNIADNYPTTDVRLRSFPGTNSVAESPLSDLYVDLQRKFISPIFEAFWTYKVKTWQWTFLARYKVGEQPMLAFHHDDCTAALIVALNEQGKDFSGGGTCFEKQRFTDTKPVGWGTLHPSRLTHRHGAKAVTSGTRYVLNTFID